jgi:hypothetical protein
MAIALVAVLAASLGAAGGYALAQREASALDSQRRDLITAVRAADLNNRLAMLRLMRERKTSDDDIRSLEISAIALLDAIPLDEAGPTSQSFVVLREAAKRVATYSHDFPTSEFTDQRHRNVGQLLAIGAR